MRVEILIRLLYNGFVKFMVFISNPKEIILHRLNKFVMKGKTYEKENKK